MVFKVLFTKDGQKDLIGCINYIYFSLGDPFAAESFLNDVFVTVKRLESSATSYALCDLEKLGARGFRKVHLKKHHSKIIYHIEKTTVYIDAILRDRQDIENFFVL